MRQAWIYIPTNRLDVPVLNFLSPYWYRRTIISADPQVYSIHTTANYGTLVIKQPTDVAGKIGPIRQHLMFLHEQIHDRNSVVINLDDDVIFQTRIGPRKYRTSTIDEVSEGLNTIAEAVTHPPVAIASFGSEFRAAWQPETLIFSNTAPNRCWAMNFHTFLDVGAHFSDVEGMEDWHINLSLLKHGFENRIYNTWVCKDKNLKGGCYRDKDVIERWVNRFIELHSPYARKRITKNAQQIKAYGTDLDVTVNWKAAAKQGAKLRNPSV